MIVTFVSECEKKAIKRTRQVLDAFANRIGERTWQTLITQEGLRSVHQQLRQSATKNTAVACHRIRGTQRSELMWIVGNTRAFNALGHVPVNRSRQTHDLEPNRKDSGWDFLPQIVALTAFAALLHDWGKASACFQNKLNPELNTPSADPLRHEWVSCVLFRALLQQVGDQDDTAWLTLIAEGEWNESQLQTFLSQHAEHQVLADLPPVASWIAWLVLSHHRLPILKGDTDALRQFKTYEPQDFQQVLSWISHNWGYQNWDDTYSSRLSSCFVFPDGLLSKSDPWIKQLRRAARRLLSLLPALKQSLHTGTWRLLLHHSRLSLMLGDHRYSSQDADQSWKSSLILYANTTRDRKMNQRLDEHLVNVAKMATEVAYLLPRCARDLPHLQRTTRLRRQSPPDFAWQDKAVKTLQSLSTQACFVINLASTGSGKTLANAKIMRAVSGEEGLRYILAVGLRTLTLQTGDAYRERMGLNEQELAVLIGSQAILDLHQSQLSEWERAQRHALVETGKESQETLLEGELHFANTIADGPLNTLFTLRNGKTNQKALQFLSAPVLVCTIDHLMAATETKRGGRYILPALRLLSSDLVIDEIDDFQGSDLIAIGRLIHLAGMLGRKVILSSATIPPDLAEGYFHAYQSGWQHYQRAHGFKSQISAVWIDEFSSHLEKMKEQDSIRSYRELHARFVQKRVTKLLDPRLSPARRKGKVVACQDIFEYGLSEREHVYFERMREAIVEQHCLHFRIDESTQKRVSFGVVRTANVDPCIRFARYLIQCDWEDNLAPKVMAYHSRQVLLLRHLQEVHLDAVLQGGKPFQDPTIRAHLDAVSADDVLFLVIATPVEEIGRDHDFDWALVEPSSYRSLIQLAGRVLRHRKLSPESANVAIMQYNLRALQHKEQAYMRPGYESAQFQLETHDVAQLLDKDKISAGIDAIPRIQKPEQLFPQKRLADLEHAVLAQLLSDYCAKGPDSLEGWLCHNWWLTALPQYFHPFRSSASSLDLVYLYQNERLFFAQKDNKGTYQIRHEKYQIYDLKDDNQYQERFWLKRDYLSALSELTDQYSDLTQASEKYGAISIPLYGNDSTECYYYNDQYGFERKLTK